jgi:hypothetical protein
MNMLLLFLLSSYYKDDDSASAQSSTNMSHARRRDFRSASRSASRPRTFSLGREPMFNRNPSRGSGNGPNRGRDHFEGRGVRRNVSESCTNERFERDNWRCTEVRVRWMGAADVFLLPSDTGLWYPNQTIRYDFPLSKTCMLSCSCTVL